MTRALRLFILAGEPSGDRIAADLVQRLKAHGPLELSGVGGDELIGQGLTPLYPMTDLSVMGISDVLKRLPRLLFRVAQTARAIMRQAPDIVVLVDAQVFSQLVAKALRVWRYRGPVLLYVAPTVWARSPHRALKLKALFDEVLAVLPFEPAVMARLGGPPTRYAGHPALAEPSRRLPGGRRIALLPGSREGELRRQLPMFRVVAEALAARHPDLSFFMPTLPNPPSWLRTEITSWRVSVSLLSDRDRRPEVYRETAMAIVCAGTATLELALAEIPLVLTYVMDGHQVAGYTKLGNPRVGLPNIILDEDVTPELVLAAPDAERVIAAALPLIEDPATAQRQVDAFRRLRVLMEEGAPGAPRYDPAEIVLSHARQV